jgi:hypothetical protein
MTMPGYRVLLLALGAAALASALMFRVLASRAHECSPSMGDLRAMDFRGEWTVELTPDSARELPTARIGRP